MRTARESADRHALRWLIGVLGIVAVVVGYALYTRDPVVDCTDPTANASNTVLVIDRSESMSAQTIVEIEARALAHVMARPVGERVSVFAVSDSSTNALLPLFDGCRTKTGSEANPLTEDGRRLERRFRENFLGPIATELRREVVGSRTTPLAQALTDLSLGSHLRGRENHLLVFSDLLEHTAGFSLYSCRDARSVIGDFRAARRGAVERPTFSNTSVQLHIVPRGGVSDATIRCRDRLWPWFFGDSSGNSAGVSIAHLPGPAEVQ